MKIKGTVLNYGKLIVVTRILKAYRLILEIECVWYIFAFQVVESHCGRTEKQNQDTLDDLKQVIKDKDEIIEVICVKHIYF